MASTVETTKAMKAGFEESAESKTFPIRMTLTSTKMKAVEQACRDVIGQAIKKDIRVRGPARMPTRVLRITTRKTPCGEGSKTWDKFEMRIHKRVVDFTCSMLAMREITAIKIEPGVDVEVSVQQA